MDVEFQSSHAAHLSRRRCPIPYPARSKQDIADEWNKLNLWNISKTPVDPFWAPGFKAWHLPNILTASKRGRGSSREPTPARRRCGARVGIHAPWPWCLDLHCVP
jgi:hypothetical protein